jgi:hypothetical protein
MNLVAVNGKELGLPVVSLWNQKWLLPTNLSARLTFRFKLKLLTY